MKSLHPPLFTAAITYNSQQGALLCCRQLPNPNAKLYIRAATRRRQNPRRRHENFQNKSSLQVPNSSDDKIVIMVDMNRMSKRAADFVEEAGRASEGTIRRIVDKAKGLASDGAEVLKDLRTSVALDRDKRLVIVVRRSSLEFLANVLIYSIFAVAIYKLFSRAARKYRWGWEEAMDDGQGLVRRDRSLAGREVLVSKRGLHSNSTNTRKTFKSMSRISSPLASVGESRSERELMKLRTEQQRERKEINPLPTWWPAPDIPPVISIDEFRSAQSEANALLKVIMDNRMSGRDFMKEEIIQLRQICKNSGVTVSFEMANVRDSFYRAAIGFVLAACSSFTSGSSLAQIGGEEATRFIAGLAGNIGIKADRAATMVNAAVAAQTRSTFLQAWALKMQGRNFEVDEHIIKLSRIHSLFPPEANSPEMEMVAQGLERHLQLDERKQLLKLYIEVCGTVNQRVATEALGLISTWGRS